LVSSVLPTPVGPRNMNEPIGRFGSCRPARRGARRSRRPAPPRPGRRRASRARLPSQQLLALAFQHLVDRDAGPARDDGGDVLGRHHFLDHRASPACGLRPRLPSSLLEVGMSP
jgi:hypothetical protein